MKLSELIEELNRMLARGDDEDLEVVVETQNGGCPHRYLSPVNQIVPGFDWTQGRLIILTKDPLVVVHGLQGSLQDLAKKQLESLKEVHDKLSFKYIAKAREKEWMDGFVEGVRTHITACNEKGAAPAASPEAPVGRVLDELARLRLEVGWAHYDLAWAKWELGLQGQPSYAPRLPAQTIEDGKRFMRERDAMEAMVKKLEELNDLNKRLMEQIATVDAENKRLRNENIALRKGDRNAE